LKIEAKRRYLGYRELIGQKEKELRPIINQNIFIANLESVTAVTRKQSAKINKEMRRFLTGNGRVRCYKLL
jgi:hypothetical protein